MTAPANGKVTFLFTDIEGSTRRWQDEPEAMPGLLTEHDGILHDAIDPHGGHLFEHTGDGAAAVCSHIARLSSMPSSIWRRCVHPARLSRLPLVTS